MKLKNTISLFLFVLMFKSYSQEINLEVFANGFSNPVAIENAGDDRLFVVERGGAIKILNSSGSINATNFLTLNSSIVLSGGERGLLGLAFHPDYENNRFFYINYTKANDGATVIARYQTNESNPNIADPTSASVIMTIPQPYSNHNGGTIKFGPDGYLYIGMGDGGSGGDPQNYGQNINSLLGKMLRIDIDGEAPYSIPPTNPFVGIEGADEIWSVGMRNPWKFSFNRLNGDLWIADVGQNASEEINKVSAPLTAGLNFGWRCYEADLIYNASGCGNIDSYFFPISKYPLDNVFCSITGGYVYTGSMYPNFQNKYFFTDFCANRIGFIDENGSDITWTNSFSGNFSTFGEDINGELYVAGLSNGTVYKLVDESLGIDTFESQGFKIFPNPASSYFTIKNSMHKNWKTITIYDLTGKNIGQFSPSSDLNFTVNCEKFTRGIYTLIVETSEKEVYKTKICLY